MALALSGGMLKYLPVVDPDACTSCVACVDVCTPGCLEMQDGLPVLTHPETCGSDEHCVTACNTEAIRMEWVPAEGDPTVGQWRGSDSEPADVRPHP